MLYVTITCCDCGNAVATESLNDTDYLITEKREWDGTPGLWGFFCSSCLIKRYQNLLNQLGTTQNDKTIIDIIEKHCHKMKELCSKEQKARIYEFCSLCGELTEVIKPTKAAPIKHPNGGYWYNTHICESHRKTIAEEALVGSRETIDKLITNNPPMDNIIKGVHFLVDEKGWFKPTGASRRIHINDVRRF